MTRLIRDLEVSIDWIPTYKPASTRCKHGWGELSGMWNAGRDGHNSQGQDSG